MSDLTKFGVSRRSDFGGSDSGGGDNGGNGDMVQFTVAAEGGREGGDGRGGEGGGELAHSLESSTVLGPGGTSDMMGEPQFSQSPSPFRSYLTAPNESAPSVDPLVPEGQQQPFNYAGKHVLIDYKSTRLPAYLPIIFAFTYLPIYLFV